MGCYASKGFLGPILMSKGRLQDLQAILRTAGWEIANKEEMFCVGEDELIHWTLVNKDRNLKVEADFYVVGGFGERSYDLNDIVHCRIPSHGIEMLFPKRKTERWRRNMRDFVLALSQIGRGGGGEGSKSETGRI